MWRKPHPAVPSTKKGLEHELQGSLAAQSAQPASAAPHRPGCWWSPLQLLCAAAGAQPAHEQLPDDQHWSCFLTLAFLLSG